MRWLLAVCLAAARCLAQDDMARARRIQSEAIGIDTHIDTAQRLLYENVDLTRKLADGHVDLPRLREGGMHAPFFSLWVPVYYHGAEAVHVHNQSGKRGAASSRNRREEKRKLKPMNVG